MRCEVIFNRLFAELLHAGNLEEGKQRFKREAEKIRQDVDAGSTEGPSLGVVGILLLSYSGHAVETKEHMSIPLGTSIDLPVFPKKAPRRARARRGKS